MNFETPCLEELDRHVGELVEASGPAQAFKVLLGATRCAAPRAAIFLVRQGAIHGWGSVGYDSETARRQRAFSCALADGRLGRLASDPAGPLERGAGGDPDFGQPRAAESIAVAVRVKNTPIALLLAERASGEEPWSPAALGVATAVGQLRLELDLALRKLQAAVPADAVATEAVAASPSASFAPSIPTAVEGIGLVSAPTAGAGTQTDDLEPARRYARLVATDIRLYNEEAVVLGRRNGDLIARLGENLGRGKETFLRRHGDLGPTGLQILHEAYVQVLAAGDRNLLPASALD